LTTNPCKNNAVLYVLQALIIPVIHRGLRDRSGDAKKRAARIVGNLCALVNDPQDMAPYVDLLMPDIKTALSDPLPEVGGLFLSFFFSFFLSSFISGYSAVVGTLLMFVQFLVSLYFGCVLSSQVSLSCSRGIDYFLLLIIMFPPWSFVNIQVRATAARAMGQLVGGMGNDMAGQLIPWLTDRLQSEASAAERSGAAQALSEVLSVRGPASTSAVLPGIFAGCRSRNPACREGCLTLFRYLPRVAPDSFRTHLQVALPCVLDGLADESEGVRDAALAAGRTAVEVYSGTDAVPLLLPAVEAGMASANWRIRQSSVDLLGDLLYKVSGATGRIQQDLADEEGEGISVEAHGRAIIEALGEGRRNEVLARLYVARSDVAYTVRSGRFYLVSIHSIYRIFGVVALVCRCSVRVSQ
jgi:hypothetical protein